MAIYKNQKLGSWYVVCWFTNWKGERKQKCKRGFSTKREAQEWERQFQLQKKANVEMTLESFARLYENDVKPKLKLNTWVTKENIIQKKILPYLGKRKLSEITARDVVCWQNEMRGLKRLVNPSSWRSWLTTSVQGKSSGTMKSTRERFCIWPWRMTTSDCRNECPECLAWRERISSTLPSAPNSWEQVWTNSWKNSSGSILTPA